MKALAILIALAGTARADRWTAAADKVQAGFTLHYELSGVRSIDDTMTAPDDLVLAGVRIAGFVGKRGPLLYHLRIDLAAGSTVDRGGLAYDVALYPLGLAIRLGATGLLGVSGGIGATGAIDTVNDAMLLPASVVFEVGRGWRLLGRGRISYVVGGTGERELEGMLGVRFGHAYRWNDFKSGNGVFVGASVRELAGTRFAGITLGYSIDGALPRRTSP